MYYHVQRRNATRIRALPADQTPWLVGKRRGKPALHFFDRLTFATSVVGDLIQTEPADGEVFRLRVREVQAADASGRRHRRVLGERESNGARVEEVEQLELLAVIGTRRIPEPRADRPVTFRYDVVGGQRLVKAPVFPRSRVQVGRKRL